MTELENSARRTVHLTLVPAVPVDPVVPTVDFETWLRQGMDNAFIGPPVCEIHDGLPTTADEDAEFDEHGEVCVHVLRLYRDAAEKAAVEVNHAPSVWRRTNMG